MRVKTPSLKRLAFLLVIVVPVAAWMLVKPVRVLAPSLVGIGCVSETVCTDDLSKSQDAVALYAEAHHFVSVTLNPFKTQPKVIFCATDRCADAFGLGARSAVTVGHFGSVIGPRAWKNYYVRHELIHVAQAEQLGTIALLFKPQWFVEGMAYGLSEDPRPTLAESYESDQVTFRKWLQTIDRRDLWKLASDL